VSVKSQIKEYSEISPLTLSLSPAGRGDGGGFCIYFVMTLKVFESSI
jgi:hypothetical protein